MHESPERFSLLIVLTVSVLAPLIAMLIPRVRVPAVVLEIVFGVLVGPHVLGWVKPGPMLNAFAAVGMSYLFFLAGFEIDLKKLRGRPITLGILGWILSFAIALAIGWILAQTGLVQSDVLIGIALSTTAIGTLLPILRDAGELETVFGKYMLAAGAMGEFGPILFISIALTAGGHSGIEALGLLVIYLAITLAVAFLAMRVQPPGMVTILRNALHTSTQLPIRLAILLLGGLIFLTVQFGLDSILGAVAAGMIVALVTAGESGEAVRHRLESIGFGFFIPVFFVVSGIRFDLGALLGSPTSLLLVPLYLLLFLLVRGLPVLLYRGDLPRADLLPLALYSATALPLVVAITEIGLQTDRLSAENAAALVGAGMVSVLVFPLLATMLRPGPVAEIVSHAHPVKGSEKE